MELKKTPEQLAKQRNRRRKYNQYEMGLYRKDVEPSPVRDVTELYKAENNVAN